MTVGRPQTAASRTGQRTGRPEAVLFDMDGVVTDTASAHAAAWKRLFDEYLRQRANRSGEDFAPFDIDADYREYVDGKPRYDGVKSFLESRGIELPFGDPGDGPDAKTICGLGNRKNRYFHDWLAENRVGTFPSTVHLLHALRAAGIRTGLFTSSRNGAAVLENTGVGHLFEATVDGVDLGELGIRGKPDPAMLLEAAARLDAAPERTAVVEDATSGVAAGSAGGFAPIIGVNRDDYGDALAARGADIVVGDLGELAFDPDSGFAVKTLQNLPSVWDREAEIRTRLADRRIVVFLDYDGTVTPIVENFTQAYLADAMRESVRQLAERCTVGLVSGRDFAALKKLVGLDSVLYAGSHGFEIALPGEGRETLRKGERFLPDLDDAENTLERELRAIEGCAVERKRFAIAVHYRRVAHDDIARVEAAVDGVVAGHPSLRKGHGKKVFQVQPRIDWNKGRAIDWLLERLTPDRGDLLPIYVGDDLTDEDAFRVLAGRGVGVVIRDGTRPTAAEYGLAGPEDLQRFLGFLMKAVEEEG